MNLQYKNITDSLKDIDLKTREVAFYVSKFGVVDSHNEFTTKETFKNTLKDVSRVKHFLDHKTNQLVGKVKALEIDEKGLFVVSKLNRKSIAEDLYLDYQDEAITEHSTGCSNVKREKQSDGSFEITDCKLWEVSSLQAWGSNPETNTVSVKSITEINEELLLKISDLQAQINELKEGKHIEKSFSFQQLVNNLNLK